MDVTTSLKSLLLAVRQYRDSRTAQNAAQLKKQVEVRWMFCLLGPRLSAGDALCDVTKGTKCLIESGSSPTSSCHCK